MKARSRTGFKLWASKIEAETKVTETFLIEDVANAAKANESLGTNL